MNRVHARHRDEDLGGLRHIIIPFHDSTFECVAPRWTYEVENTDRHLTQMIAMC